METKQKNNASTFLTGVLNQVLDPVFLKFGCVGLFNTALDFIVFFTCHMVFGLDLVTSNVLSFSIALLNSYLMNKFWSFKSSKRYHKLWLEFTLFIGISSLSVLFNTLILVYGAPYFPLILLKVVGAILTPLFNYVMYKYVVFKIPRDD